MNQACGRRVGHLLSASGAAAPSLHRAWLGALSWTAPGPPAREQQTPRVPGPTLPLLCPPAGLILRAFRARPSRWVCTRNAPFPSHSTGLTSCVALCVDPIVCVGLQSKLNFGKCFPEISLPPQSLHLRGGVDSRAQLRGCGSHAREVAGIPGAQQRPW